MYVFELICKGFKLKKYVNEYRIYSILYLLVKIDNLCLLILKFMINFMIVKYIIWVNIILFFNICI